MSDKKFSLFQILALHNRCMALTVMQRLVNDYAGAQNCFINFITPLSMDPKQKIFRSESGPVGVQRNFGRSSGQGSRFVMRYF